MKMEDIKHLASLARIEITEEEARALAEEFDDILGYVERVTEVSALGKQEEPFVGVLSNVFRRDVETHEPGAYTEALLAAAPEREEQYVRVKKILEHNG